MALIPREVVEAVRERTDLVEVISRHVKLAKRGGSHVGLCPFHQEKSPSFHVVPHKSFYHCFGCGASGDVFRFLQEIEGLSFAEAVRELAGPAGVEIRTEDLTEAERVQLRQRATLYDVLSDAAGLYASTLLTRPEGAEARAYLARRGITDDTIRTWQLGWAPDAWQTLLDHLRSQGVGPQLAIDAGLARRRDHGDGAYDAFRARVMIPIHDDRGRVIAMGGRLLEGDGPKYINSPETSLYRKSSVLFGMDKARRAIERTGRAILVEGYFDVISLHQAGFDEAVATCGTALTSEHAEKLRRMCRKVYVITDADAAGMRAAERALPLLEKAHIASYRVQIPGAKDPDELVREHGADAFEALLGDARPLLAWVGARMLREHGDTAAGKDAARDALVDLLGGLSPVQAIDLAPVLRVPEGELTAWAKAHGQPRTSRRSDAASSAAAPPTGGYKPTREMVHLLWLAVHRPDEASPLLRRLPPALLDPPVRSALARLLDGDSPPAILDDASDPGVRRTLSAVVARATLYREGEAAPAVADIAGRLARQRSDGWFSAQQDAAVAALRRGEQAQWTAHAALTQQIDAARRGLEDALKALATARRMAASGRPDALAALDPSSHDVMDAADALHALQRDHAPPEPEPHPEPEARSNDPPPTTTSDDPTAASYPSDPHHDADPVGAPSPEDDLPIRLSADPEDDDDDPGAWDPRPPFETSADMS